LGKSDHGDYLGTLADCTRALALVGVAPRWRAQALFARALAYRKLGDNISAKADYLAIVDLPDAPHDILGFAKFLLATSGNVAS